MQKKLKFKNLPKMYLCTRKNNFNIRGKISEIIKLRKIFAFCISMANDCLLQSEDFASLISPTCLPCFEART